MSYPDQFKFTHESTSATFCMQKANCEGEYVWLCTRVEEGYADSFRPGHFAQYVADEITSNLNRKCWKMVVDEPELVFPFTFRVHGDGDAYTATKGGSRGVVVSWEEKFSTTCVEYEERSVRDYVKRGVWIVTSVGEQKPADVHDYFFKEKEKVLRVDTTTGDTISLSHKDIYEFFQDVKHILKELQRANMLTKTQEIV